MEKIDKNIKTHLFICCRERDGKASCAERGALDLVRSLKQWTKEKGIKDQVKVSSSSCLGHCEEGITACLYPQKQWFTKLSLEDEKQLQELLLATPDSL